ncbi:hypothetical protein SLAVM298S_03042 [Streptomyces lavendulae subsp. lavendulae]
MPASHRWRSSRIAPPGPVSAPTTSGSGKCGRPRPRSATGSRTHSSPARTVSASRAAARPGPAPDASAIRSASARIVAGSFSQRSPQSSLRRSIGRSSRPASSTSAIRCCAGSAYRTAFDSTAGTPSRSARPSVRAASRSEPGPVPGTPQHTASSRRFTPASPRHGTISRSARSGRPADRARTGSESGPNRTSSSSSAYCPSVSQDTTGGPPAACAADTRRQSRAHPAALRASSVTRSGGSTTCAPPRTGVRDFPVEPLRSGVWGATATSTPKTGRMPAALAAFANRTAPVTVSRSVRARVPMPRSAARCTRSRGWEAP